RAAAMPACSEVAMPSAHRGLSTSRSFPRATDGSGSSTAPRTTYVAARSAATTLSIAHSTRGRPRYPVSSLWPCPPDAMNREPPPAARSTPATRTPLPVDRSGGVAQGASGGLPGALGDDLGADRHGGLLGCAGPDVEPDRGTDAGQSLGGDARV